MYEHRDDETGEVPVPIALIEQAPTDGCGQRADGATGPWPYLANGLPTAATRPVDVPAATAVGRYDVDAEEGR
jgi:hypothetical protein